jgi:hypothetical protein
MHQIITGSAARHNSGVRHNFRADCNIQALASQMKFNRDKTQKVSENYNNHNLSGRKNFYAYYDIYVLYLYE